jgi:hypothetical protein
LAVVVTATAVMLAILPTAHASDDVVLPISAIDALVQAEYPQSRAVSATSVNRAELPLEDLDSLPSDAKVFLITVELDAGPMNIGALVADADQALMVIRANDGRTYDLFSMELDGTLLDQMSIPVPAGTTDCRDVDLILAGAAVICNFTFVASAPCKTVVAVVKLGKTFVCNFDPTYTITVHRDPYGVTECTYGPVSGQYYTMGARCKLQYHAERGPVGDFPNTPRAYIRSVSGYMTFHRDSATYDVGANNFDNSRFRVRTVIAGIYHEITTPTTLQTGTSTKPRYGRLTLPVSYSDGSFVVARDSITIY